MRILKHHSIVCKLGCNVCLFVTIWSSSLPPTWWPGSRLTLTGVPGRPGPPTPPTHHPLTSTFPPPPTHHPLTSTFPPPPTTTTPPLTPLLPLLVLFLLLPLLLLFLLLLPSLVLLPLLLLLPKPAGPRQVEEYGEQT